MSKQERATEDVPSSNDDHGLYGHPKLRLEVASSPFAGRIGGNQEFVASHDDERLKTQPDAVCVIPFHA
jgi:hypothetical protein